MSCHPKVHACNTETAGMCMQHRNLRNVHAALKPQERACSTETAGTCMQHWNLRNVHAAPKPQERALAAPKPQERAWKRRCDRESGELETFFLPPTFLCNPNRIPFNKCAHVFLSNWSLLHMFGQTPKGWITNIQSVKNSVNLPAFSILSVVFTSTCRSRVKYTDSPRWQWPLTGVPLIPELMQRGGVMLRTKKKGT